MFDRFTDRARKVMSFSRQEADRFNHDYIGTEHMLLGLVKEGNGVASVVLENLGIDLERVRLEVEKMVKPLKDAKKSAQLPFTPRAKQVLELALDEARCLDHNYIGTEHLLLGILRENEGLAAQVLLNCGVTLPAIRKEVLEFLGKVDSDSETNLPAFPKVNELAAAGLPVHPWTAFGPALFHYCTLTTRHVLNDARETAQAARHPAISSEHLLWGLCRAQTETAAVVLERLGASPIQIRTELERRMQESGSAALPEPPPEGVPGAEHIPFTPSLAGVLERAYEEVRLSGQRHIATEHLLLALVRQPEGLAGEVLAPFKLDLAQLHHEIETVLKAAAVRRSEDAKRNHRLLAETARAEGVNVAERVDRITGTLHPPGRENHLDWYSDGAMLAIGRARQCCLDGKRKVIECEDLLAGVLAEKNGTAALALLHLGIDRAKLHESAEKAADQIGPPVPQPPPTLIAKALAGAISDLESPPQTILPFAEEEAAWDFNLQNLPKTGLAITSAIQEHRDALKAQKDAAVGKQNFDLAAAILDRVKQLDDRLRTLRGMGILPETPLLQLSYAKHAYTVLEQAWEERTALGHARIGSGHLLIALLRQHETPTHLILAGAGMELYTLRLAVCRFEDTPWQRFKRSLGFGRIRPDERIGPL